jgi:hypothetical protein
MMLVLRTASPELEIDYVTADPGRYEYSSLRAVARHITWCGEYLAVRELDEAITSLKDLQAIHAELADDGDDGDENRER